MRIKVKVPDCKTNDDGLFIPPYNVYNIDNGRPKRLLVFVQILQEELIRVDLLPADFDI